ncbi:MAG: hypothetical protein ABJH68_15885 [Ilumatobacter sp.]|uniref:hypothetical protein n=1 Tax=Ilumatobacter sp. TaxID=1967498 RepID=UPI0032973123
MTSPTTFDLVVLCAGTEDHSCARQTTGLDPRPALAEHFVDLRIHERLKSS